MSETRKSSDDSMIRVNGQTVRWQWLISAELARAAYYFQVLIYLSGPIAVPGSETA